MRNGRTFNDRAVDLSIITQFYPPDYAATGQLIEELAHHLAAQGVPTHVFTGQPGYAFQKDSAPTFERTGRVFVQRSRTSRLCPQRIRGKAINGLLFCVRAGLHLLRKSKQKDVLLITTAPPYLPILGYLANRLLGIPYVCLIYDLYPDIAVELKVLTKHHWLARFWTLLNQAIWRRSLGVIVLSSTMKERIVNRYPTIAHKVSVIHNWADPNWIVPLSKQANWFAQEHNLVEKFTVLYSGNMGRCHDIDTILETAQQLQQDPVQFVFIGSGAKKQACIDQVKALGLTNCLFLPYQEKQTLPYSLTACDLSLVSIGLQMEGLIAPSKLYSTLAAGRPVAAICEPHSYLHEILSEANCGKAFSHGDAAGLAEFIRCLVNDRTLAQRMGKAGRRYLKLNFAPDLIAKQYLAVLRLEARHPVQSVASADLSQSWSVKLGFSKKG